MVLDSQKKLKESEKLRKAVLAATSYDSYLEIVGQFVSLKF
jgi:hypothetical protein